MPASRVASTMSIRGLHGQPRRVTALLALITFVSLGAAFVKAESEAGTWTLERPLPVRLAEVAAVAANGHLHTIGGNLNNVAVTAHDAYDPDKDAWRTLADLPEPRDHVAVAQSDGKIFAAGGFATPVHKNSRADVFEYDIANDTWRRLPAMTVARGAAGAAIVDGELHVLGGRGDDGVTLAAHEVYDLHSGRWKHAAPLPQARDHLAVVVMDDKIHVIGGRLRSPVERVGRHDVYDPKMDRWTSAAPLPTPRSGVAAVLYNGLILVLGGELPPDHTFPDNEGYDAKTDSWITLSPMPHGRHGFGGGVIGRYAYFVGGSLTPGDGGPTDQLIRFSLP